MTPLELADYGITFFSIGAIITLIFQFMRYIGKLRDTFLEVITNHMKHESECNERFREATDKLTDTVKELLEFLRYHNGNKK